MGRVSTAAAAKGRPARSSISTAKNASKAVDTKSTAKKTATTNATKAATTTKAAAKRGRPSTTSNAEKAAPAKRGRPSLKDSADADEPAPAKRGRPSGVGTKKSNATAKVAKAKKPAKVVRSEAPAKKGTKRAREEESEEVAHPTKRARAPKAAKPLPIINEVPTKPLDIYVFGSGESGELGLGAVKRDGKKPSGVKRPRLNDLLDANKVGVVQIAAGGMHCVALTKGQQILTWGVNDNGALGRDTTWEAPTKDLDAASDSGSDSDDGDDTGMNPKECTPTAIPAESFGKGRKGFVQVVATDSASFALTAKGHVYGWGTFRLNDGVFGFDSASVLKGQETKQDKDKTQHTPKLIPELQDIKSLAAGGNHVLALDTKGKVWGWGAFEEYQLARAFTDRTKIDSLTPQMGPPIRKIATIACGSYHSFAVDLKGRVYAWGLNNYGQTGIPTGAGDDMAVVTKPKVVENLTDFNIKDIEGGLQHSIACSKDGRLLVWGRCDEGQAGVDLDKVSKDDLVVNSAGKPAILKKPTLVPIPHITTVSAGIDDCIAIDVVGKAYAWGYSEGGRTGLGTEDPVTEAMLIDNTAVKGKALTVAACGGQFSLLAGPMAPAAPLTNGV